MDYVNAGGSNFISLVITCSNNEAYSAERRFNKEITIQEFKNKLELQVGCQAATMKLEVYNKNDEIICVLDANDSTLSTYPLENGMRVHVSGSNEPTADEATVEKFELSEEEYAKRSDTVQAFLRERKLGKYNEEEAKKKEEERIQELEKEKKLIDQMKINDRCEVIVPGNPKRRATIMYIGKTEFKSGWWVGVKYDEPFGKNNGSVAGKKYFECHDKYGGFVRPTCIAVGDFPEEDFDLNEEL